MHNKSRLHVLVNFALNLIIQLINFLFFWINSWNINLYNHHIKGLSMMAHWYCSVIDFLVAKHYSCYNLLHYVSNTLPSLLSYKQWVFWLQVSNSIPSQFLLPTVLICTRLISSLTVLRFPMFMLLTFHVATVILFLSWFLQLDVPKTSYAARYSPLLQLHIQSHLT